MKRLVGVAGALVGVLIVAGCESGGARVVQDEAMQRVRAVSDLDRTLDEWHRAAATGDFDAYFSRMTEDAVFLGTDASERWVGEEFRAFARPYFKGPTAYGEGAWTYRPVERHIAFEAYEEGEAWKWDDVEVVAWFDEILMHDTYGRCRGTGVAQRDDGRWRIAHYSLTFLVPNDIAGEVTGRVRAFEAGG